MKLTNSQRKEIEALGIRPDRVCGISMSFTNPYNKDGYANYVKFLQAIENGCTTRKEIVEEALNKDYRPGFYTSTFSSMSGELIIFNPGKGYRLSSLGKRYLQIVEKD